MIHADPDTRAAAARKGWENRRARLARPAFTRRDRRRSELAEMRERVQLLEVQHAEQYALLRVFEERFLIAPRPAKEDENG